MIICADCAAACGNLAKPNFHKVFQKDYHQSLAMEYNNIKLSGLAYKEYCTGLQRINQDLCNPYKNAKLRTTAFLADVKKTPSK